MLSVLTDWQRLRQSFHFNDWIGVWLSHMTTWPSIFKKNPTMTLLDAQPASCRDQLSTWGRIERSMVPSSWNPYIQSLVKLECYSLGCIIKHWSTYSIENLSPNNKGFQLHREVAATILALFCLSKEGNSCGYNQQGSQWRSYGGCCTVSRKPTWL